jgi:hypothetical protein
VQIHISWCGHCARCSSIPVFFLLTPSIETVSAMASLFLALVLYPEAQTRAQAELDAVLGRDRLPTLDDRPRLPYIEAVCKELMRWQMVTPMGLSFSISIAQIRMSDSCFRSSPSVKPGRRLQGLFYSERFDSSFVHSSAIYVWFKGSIMVANAWYAGCYSCRR